ncbi:hypothetical protein DM02DRAFT_651307 [Periconia macrospinosa]|uniref:Uncharacterized protein n=1 Tax=Periconia macrospinosa TaxID=97972 RepID=A0A2V1E6F4_9PLEO|nr:hypothetical protein DM02DRAFT_651307 [Periconia macrospinosa]
MPGLLGRSKSFRMLRKGGHDGPHPRETDKTTPPVARSHLDVGRLKEAPVPITDRSVETPDMLQRPQTSGGVGDRPPPFHKVRPFHHENNSFNFAPHSPAKPNALLYAAEVYESTEGVIGIALGSPTMASHSQWNVASPGSDFTTNTQGPVTHISSNYQPMDPYSQNGVVDVQQDMPKPKLSRWRSLFKKTGPPPRSQEKEPFYQLSKTMPPARADSHHDEEPQEEEQSIQSPASYSYNPSIRESRKLPKGQPQPAVDTRPRALTLNTAQQKPKMTLLRSASNAISPRFPKKAPSPPIVPQVVVSSDPKPTSSQPWSTLSTEKPLLNVAIPEVRMERYSVMFSSLLQENGASNPCSDSTSTASPIQKAQDSTPTLTASSSLLQRRQAEQLKPLDRLSIKNPSQNSSLKPQRRATSPAHAKSPSGNLSLFPSPNTSRAPSPRSLHSSVNRPRPVRRSHTEPVNDSPRHSKFFAQDEDLSIGVALTPQISEVITPMTSTPMTSSPTSYRNSFDSTHDELTVKRSDVVANSKPLVHEDSKEPEWEILAPKRFPSAKITKSDALRSHPSVGLEDPPSSAPLDVIATASPVTLIRSPSNSVRVSQHVISLSPAARSATTPTPTSAKTTTATVGIARSVSVSRTNSPLLKPASAGVSPNTIDARLGDPRALTPTLVELGKNRRSHRVQLVDA